MEKIKSLFSDKKLLIILIVITTVAIIKVFLGFIYVKDEPKIVPEKTREDIRGVIKEDIAAPIAKVIPAVGKPFVEVAYQKPQVKNANPGDETANWKTYKNEEYGFELKYPEELIISENENVTNFKEEDNIFFSIYSYKTRLNASEFWEKESGNIPANFIKEKNINIGEMIVYKFKEINGMGEIHYIFVKDGHGYDLLTLSGDESEIIKILDTLI